MLDPHKSTQLRSWHPRYTLPSGETLAQRREAPHPCFQWDAHTPSCLAAGPLSMAATPDAKPASNAAVTLRDQSHCRAPPRHTLHKPTCPAGGMKSQGSHCHPPRGQTQGGPVPCQAWGSRGAHLLDCLPRQLPAPWDYACSSCRRPCLAALTPDRPGPHTHLLSRVRAQPCPGPGHSRDKQGRAGEGRGRRGEGKGREGRRGERKEGEGREVVARGGWTST